MTKELLRTTEAARRLGIPVRDVYGLIDAGELEVARIEHRDGGLRVVLQSVDDYLVRHAEDEQRPA